MMSHVHYMNRCLELAVRGKGKVAPNPMVGAILVYKQRIIGEGYHSLYGKEHAEVNCISSVKKEDRQLISKSTMYVNLEPCAHYGKTPPCAYLLAAEKIKAVFICNEDPFDQVQGKGIVLLQQNDIEVFTGILKESGNWLNRRFFCFHQQKRPYIILKWAQTQQGFFAPLNRTRFQMSNKHSQQLVHKWRTEESAILVGTLTALKDDPQLTARLWQGNQPLRIVIDQKLELPRTLRIFNNESNTWIINGAKDHSENNIRFIRFDFSKSIIPALLQLLHTANIQSLLVEGGATLLSGFIENGLWDEARIFKTPDIMTSGIPAPLLHDGQKAFTTETDTDYLEVYTRRGSPGTYIAGMEL